MFKVMLFWFELGLFMVDMFREIFFFFILLRFCFGGNLFINKNRIIGFRRMKVL